MSQRVLSGFVPALGLSLISVALLGCASGGLTRVESTRVVALRETPTSPVISNAAVYERNGERILRGEVHLHRGVPGPTIGHIDVLVRGDAGEVLARECVRQKPGHLSRRYERPSWFQVEIPAGTPENARIEVEFQPDGDPAG